MTTVVRGRSTQRSLSLRLRVGTPDVEIFDLGKTVGPFALAKGSHRLIIGRVKGGCCASLLRARIKDGRVVGIEVERCKDAAPVDPQMSRLLQEAARKLPRPKRRAKLAIPIEPSLKPAAMQRMTRGFVEETCVYFCIPIIGRCYLCCSSVWYPEGRRINWCLGGETTRSSRERDHRRRRRRLSPGLALMAPPPGPPERAGVAADAVGPRDPGRARRAAFARARARSSALRARIAAMRSPMRHLERRLRSRRVVEVGHGDARQPLADRALDAHAGRPLPRARRT